MQIQIGTPSINLRRHKLFIARKFEPTIVTQSLTSPKVEMTTTSRANMWIIISQICLLLLTTTYIFFWLRFFGHSVLIHFEKSIETIYKFELTWISCGTLTKIQLPKIRIEINSFHTKFAKRIKFSFLTPILTVYGLRSRSLGQALLEASSNWQGFLFIRIKTIRK